MDSSNNDNAGAAAMTIESEYKNKVEVNSYWTKVKVDELQNIRNPMKVLFSGTDSMSDLKTISELEDSIISILTPPNSTSLTDPENNERNQTLFNDEEMTNLVEDKGDNRHTSFNAAMLVNIEGKRSKPNCMI
jgi:hypothetical protein